ncbi:MAG: hypothetical protein ABIN97_04395 [Ginsengibacter sp.]
MRLIQLLLITFSFFSLNALGQGLRPDPGAGAAAGGDFGASNKGVTEVRFGKINNDRIKYADIKGSAFWNSEWQSAIVYINEVRAGRLTVKLNFATDELYFLKDAEELVLRGSNITRLVFDKIPEPAVFIGHVPNLRLDNHNLEGFVQVLNPGDDYELLKYTIRKVNTSDSVMSAEKRYSFYDDVYYFLKSNNKIDRIKRQTKEGFLSFLPGSSAFGEWIAQSNINFEKEMDMVRFLRYYNAQRKASL